MDLINTFRTRVIEDALLSLKKTEAARMEFQTLQDGLGKQLRSTNVGMYHRHSSQPRLTKKKPN